MKIIDEGTLKKIAMGLPICISKRLGVLTNTELKIEALLNEGFDLVLLSVTTTASYVTDPDTLCPPITPISPVYIGADRVQNIVGFVNWMLDRGHYNGHLSNYFRKTAEQLREYDTILRQDKQKNI